MNHNSFSFITPDCRQAGSLTKILTVKQKDPDADTSSLERQIDEMLYALYNLTPEEIAIVEGKK